MVRHQVNWCEDIYTEFSRLAMLNPVQREVLRMRIMGYSITRTAIELEISERTVSRIVQNLQKRYDEVQPYSSKLPVRRKSAKEEWMDHH